MRTVPVLLVVISQLALPACGDDDQSDDGTPDSGTPNAGRGAAAGSGRGSQAGGGAGTGSSNPNGSPENSPCQLPEDCDEGLRCAATPLLVNNTPVGVCAKPCAMDTECDEGVCISYTRQPRDGHCVNEVADDYALCGIADTSICAADMTCLYFPGEPVGVCVHVCSVDGSTDEDAGVPAGGPAPVACAAGMSCISDVLADSMPNEGVCGMLAANGEECGIDVDFGQFCGDGSLCVPEALPNQDSTPRCYQDCSMPGTQCQTGSCMPLQNNFAYCK